MRKLPRTLSDSLSVCLSDHTIFVPVERSETCTFACERQSLLRLLNQTPSLFYFDPDTVSCIGSRFPLANRSLLRGQLTEAESCQPGNILVPIFVIVPRSAPSAPARLSSSALNRAWATCRRRRNLRNRRISFQWLLPERGYRSSISSSCNGALNHGNVNCAASDSVDGDRCAAHRRITTKLSASSKLSPWLTNTDTRPECVTILGCCSWKLLCFGNRRVV